MGAAIDTDAVRFDKDVLHASEPVLVDFWSPTCGPCRAIAPQVEKLAQRHAGRLKVVKANTAQNPALRERFSLMGVPTLIMFVGGEEVDRVVGGYPQKIEAMVTKVLAAGQSTEPPSATSGPVPTTSNLPPIDQLIRRR